MTDCPNAEIRDLLPDYVHDQLSVTDLARVEQHLVSCAECTEELALLQAMFDSRPSVSPVNVAAIVASLPKPGQHGAEPHRDVVITSTGTDGVRDIASARSAARKTDGFRNWRAIAAVAVLAVGTVSIALVREGVLGGQGPLSDTTGVVAVATASRPDDDVALSIGDVSDYSDEELKAIMARLDKWDGATSAEPLPGVPILPPGS